MRILLYNPDNGVTRNFMPHLWMFLLQALTPPGHEVLLVDGNAQPMDETQIALIQERVKAGMRNARAKGRRIGRPPQTQLSSELRADIANSYHFGGTSLRLLAKKFGTSLATVQRDVFASVAWLMVLRFAESPMDELGNDEGSQPRKPRFKLWLPEIFNGIPTLGSPSNVGSWINPSVSDT